MNGSSWGSSDYQQAVASGRRSIRLRWIVAGLATVAVVGAAAAYWFLIHEAPRALPVGIRLSAPTLLQGGKATVTVSVSNDGALDAARDLELAVDLPERTVATVQDAAASSTPERAVVSLQDLGPGESREVSLQLMTQLEPGSAAPLRAEVSYATDRGARRFSVATEVSLVVTQPALSLSIAAPSGVARNDPFSATLRYRNNDDRPLSGASLRLVLPRGVSLVSAEPARQDGAWEIPSLAPGAEGGVALRLLAGDDAATPLGLRATISRAGEIVAEQAASVAISSEPLGLSVFSSAGESPVVTFGQSLSYRMEVRNLSKVVLKDVVLKAELGGKLFDLSTVVARTGTLDPRDPLITWNGIGNPELRAIAPGGKVSISFDVRTVRSLAGSDLSSVVTASASSPTVPAGVQASGSVASSRSVAKLAGQVAFASEAHWRDPLAQVSNAGPQPPRVGTPTQYLVRWSVAPSSAGMKDATVTAALPAGVRFTGKLAGVSASDLTYDTRTGTVTWRAGAVAAGSTKRAGFQVEVTPAANQAGREVRLAGESKLTATDAFAGVAVTSSGRELTTLLQAGTPGAGDGTVAR